jgi:hypothetical protein
MVGWLLTVGVTEIGKTIFEQVLKLGQAAAEDYVKDCFKDCLDEGVAAAKPGVTQKAVEDAQEAFLLLGLSRVNGEKSSATYFFQSSNNLNVLSFLGISFADCPGIRESPAI